MKIKELKALEEEQIELLRHRSLHGDNEAAMVLLDHLRGVSESISKWKEQIEAKERKHKQPPTQP